ncbi:MAG: HNH endonuclease [Defluviitaleaceae bacterium]|nr:HNH endonuclease [Defluviitaleaceae bacterium]
MNNLIKIYEYISANDVLFSQYVSIAKGNFGLMFAFLNTNYRAILSPVHKSNKNRYGFGGFAQGFSILEDVEGVNRDNWIDRRANNVGQEVEKQHTVRMRKAVFFQVKENAYRKTKRGEVFQRMLLDEQLSDLEKRFLCYLLILSASFDETANYLFARTAEIFSALTEQNVTKSNVFAAIREVIAWDNSAKKKKKEDLFLFDYVYYDSFFVNSAEFLPLFIVSTDLERSDFKKYISDSVRNLKGNSNLPNHSILSKKYVNGGNYTQSTLIENAWLLYVTKKLLDCENLTTFEKFIEMAISAYCELFTVDKNKLKTFIFDPTGNRSVFQIIYCELFNIPVPLKEVAKDLTPEEIEKYGIIDTTDENGYIQREIIGKSLKKLAKQQANHKCRCETAEDCRYFTSKESGQPYLEIHHFIPREFANDFDASIEVLSNYIALCPNCHRKIHLAVDNERKHLIRLLFNDCKDQLKKVQLDVDLENLFEYYKIDKYTKST